MSLSSPMMCAVADLTWQAKAIREAADKSLMARDLYAEQVAHQLSQSLKSAQEQVHRALLSYKSLGSLSDNKLAALKGLEKLNAEIADVMKALRKDQTLMFRQGSRAAFRSGVYRGIEEFASAQMPFYRDLTPDGIDKLTTSVFTLIDTDALDFMTNYNLVLAGDVHRELSDGIKRTILSGVATGKGADDIVRDLGRVIEDKESFRNAGSKVFSKAQYRMEMITRTEVLRAHNQGRMKFHRQVGVQKLEWMTMEDERTCPVCGGLDGKQFDIDKFPNIPAHPHCRCCALPAWPLTICGTDTLSQSPQGSTFSLPKADPAIFRSLQPTKAELSLHDQLWEEHGKIIESLSPTEHQALQGYMRGKCNEIVSQSRGKLSDPKLQKYVTAIESILSRSQLPAPIRVYRGDGRLPNDPVKARSLVGSRLENPGFVSTSIRAHVGAQFSGEGGIVELELPAGTHALYAGAFWRSKKAIDSRKKGVLGEAEVLLPPEVDFEITAVRTENTTFGRKAVYTATPLLKPEHVAAGTSAKADWAVPLQSCAYDSKTGNGAACILPPQAIYEQAQQQVEEGKKLKGAFESGNISNLSTLTVKQLQTLAKQNGIAVARTKFDFIKLLDGVEPGIHHGDLSGAALQAKIKQYNIAALRSKDDLMKLLAEKQAVIKQAKALEEASKNAAPQTNLSGLTMVQLKDMAKQQGISLNLTKSEVIEMLDSLEPGIDHSSLAGKPLIAAKAKHGIPPLKNKEQLVKALEKVAGQQMAEQVKQQALDAAKQEALNAAEQVLKDASSKVVIPASPGQYEGFLDSVKAAEAELAKDSGLPASVLQEHANEIALKKHAFAQQVSAMKSGELKDIAKQTKVKHWQWASKDELVKIFSETDPAKVSAAHASIETKHAKWAEKHLGKSGASAQPKVVSIPEPQAAPQPVTVAIPNTFTKKTSEFDAVDAAWADKGKPEKFKYVGNARVGGAHEKEFWADEDGNKWLFKPVGRSSDDFVGYGEETAYKIGRLVDPDAIEVRTIRLNGRVGSIQKWKTGLAKEHDFSAIDVTSLTADEIAQVQREHVIDWLISNHDGHSKQFLRAKDGKVYGIDKGQLFKFLGSDKLSIDYHPNSVCGESEPFYNTLFRAVKQGKVTVDPTVTLRYIREVEKISDDDYFALLRPYIEGRFGGDELKKKAFYDLALTRKHNLRSDFEGFYADVLGKKRYAFEDVVEIPAAGRIGKAEEQIIEEAHILGWQGKTLPIDETDIEDQNALIFTGTVGGKEQTVIKLKVRQEAESKMLPALRKADRQAGASGVGEPLLEDEFADDILLAVKTVNHHVQDGAYNKSKLDKATKHLDTLRRLIGSDDPDVREMAQVYIAWIEKTQQAARERKPISEMFETYRKKHSPPRKKVKDSDFTVRKTKVLYTKRVIKKGELSVESEATSTTSLFRGHPMPDGEQYEIDFGDGIRATYRPWSRKNLYAHSGEFEIVIPDRPDAKRLEKALEHIEKIGLKANVATADDAEILYLTKQAYITKADRDPEYTKMMTDLGMRNAAKTERIQAMRSLWEKRLGVQDITRMPGYDPAGEYQLGFRDAKIAGGYRYQYRFDISDKDMEREMKGYSLYHRLTNNSKMSTFLDNTLGNNGAMISTVEKLRSGVAPGGMSPEADMRSGGASYVFTRIRKSPLSGGSGECGLYFKKRLLRRMDAISYSHDAYGKVNDDYVASNRGSDPATWKSFSRNSSNETIFKYSITLLDNLEAVVVSSESERATVLQVFAKHGISSLPDGRRVEEVVLVR